MGRLDRIVQPENHASCIAPLIEQGLANRCQAGVRCGCCVVPSDDCDIVGQREAEFADRVQNPQSQFVTHRQDDIGPSAHGNVEQGPSHPRTLAPLVDGDHPHPHRGPIEARIADGALKQVEIGEMFPEDVERAAGVAKAKEAQTSFRLAVSADPGNDAARRALESLEKGVMPKEHRPETSITITNNVTNQVDVGGIHVAGAGDPESVARAVDARLAQTYKKVAAATPNTIVR